MTQPWTQRVFDTYDMPDGRTTESFEYRLEIMHDGYPIDTHYTDAVTEAGRVIGMSLLQAYTVRVTHQGSVNHGLVETFGPLQEP